MEIKIGVLHTSREITLESDQTQEEIEQAVSASLAEGFVLRLVDRKETVVLVPGATLAYVEIGATRKGGVGFGQL